VSDMSFLQKMADFSRRRARALRDNIDIDELRRRAADHRPPAIPDLSRSGFDVFAEIKRRSPAAGYLPKATESVVVRARSYQSAGAAAISVLTEPSAFNGSLSDLADVTSSVNCPVMCKDFLTDPVQLLEARASGASGALLIIRMLDQETVATMIATAANLGIFLLLEVFGTDDIPGLERALLAADRHSVPCFPGVNCRNLSTLKVDPHRHAELIMRIPKGLPVIAESGVAQTSDVAELATMGYRAALIGTTLMNASDSSTRLSEFIAAGRHAATSEPTA
jgi:indole-3-glycerol phosphate synthase